MLLRGRKGGGRRFFLKSDKQSKPAAQKTLGRAWVASYFGGLDRAKSAAYRCFFLYLSCLLSMEVFPSCHCFRYSSGRAIMSVFTRCMFLVLNVGKK